MIALTTRQKWMAANRERLRELGRLTYQQMKNDPIRFAHFQKKRKIWRERWNRRNPDKVLLHRAKWQLRRLYGLDWNDFCTMVKSQRGKCLICSKKPKQRLSVDHCHKTGRIRGLLCQPCNLRVGFVEWFLAKDLEVKRIFAYQKSRLVIPKPKPRKSSLHSRHPKARHAEGLRRKYNLLPNQYNELLRRQKGRCLLCNGKQKKRLTVDHNHEDKRIRGLLCHQCNLRVGFVEWILRSNYIVERIMKYLKAKKP